MKEFFKKIFKAIKKVFINRFTSTKQKAIAIIKEMAEELINNENLTIDDVLDVIEVIKERLEQEFKALANKIPEELIEAVVREVF